MNLLFIIIAAVTVVSALAAISLRNLIHCALCFATSLLGMAGIFLWLGAQFVGFAQILVYVGAVSILVVFAILLTRGAMEGPERFYGSVLVGGATALLLGGIVLTSLSMSGFAAGGTTGVIASVRAVGEKLMTTHVLGLEIIALMLTAALLGAVTLAMPEGKRA
jgi:NADH:ubiquinone oxidoreductase subunit 6 (subunit J)